MVTSFYSSVKTKIKIKTPAKIISRYLNEMFAKTALVAPEEFVARHWHAGVDCRTRRHR